MIYELRPTVDEWRCYCARCRMMELAARHEQESELETERLHSAEQQAERLLEIRERAHRQRVSALEHQVHVDTSFLLYTPPGQVAHISAPHRPLILA